MGYEAGEEKGICSLATCFCLQHAESKCFCIIGFKTLIVKKTDFFPQYFQSKMKLGQSCDCINDLT